MAASCPRLVLCQSIATFRLKPDAGMNRAVRFAFLLQKTWRPRAPDWLDSDFQFCTKDVRVFFRLDSKPR